MEEEILKTVKKSSKRLIIKCFLAVFGFIAITTIIVSIFSKEKISNHVEATGLTTTLKETPVDSNPSQESDIDNLAYLAYNISINKSFKSESRGTATSKVLGIPYVQQIHDSRIVNSNYMMQQTVSTSSMVSFGLQKFYFDDKIIRREGKPSDSDNVDWSNEAKDAITYKLAKEIYGWTPNEISPYIICDKSILSTTRVSNGENGYYEIKASLDPQKAPYYYQRQVKEFGGASDYPAFTNIELTFKFDSNWQLLNIHTEETYQISMMGMNLMISTNIDEAFSYDESTIEETDFFLNYKNLEPIGEKEDKLTSQSLLLEAFSPILNGNDETFEIELDINEKKYNILFKLNLTNNLFIGQINDNLSFAYDKTSNSIYLTYEDKSYILDLNDTTKAKKFSSFISQMLNLSNENFDLNINTNSLVDSLLSSAVTLDEETNDASIESTLNILGQDINVSFYFKKLDSGYRLNYLYASSTILDNNLSLTAKETETDLSYDITKEHTNIVKYLDILNNNINLNLTFDLSVKNTTINVKTNINLDLDNKLVYANVILKYNDISIDLDITYQDNTIKLSYGNIVVKLSNEELSNLINYISEKLNLNLDTISLSNIDINSILKSINIVLDDKLNLSLDLSSISKSLGTVILGVEDLTDSINLTLNDLAISGLSLSNLSLNVSNNATFKTISGNELTYDSLTKLVDNIYDIYQLYLNKQINGSLTFDLNVKDTTINVKTNINLDLDNKLVYANLILKYNDISIDLDITYENNTIKLSYGNIIVKLSQEEVSNLINYISEKFNLNLNLSLDNNIDVISIIKTLRVSIDDKLNLSVDLSSVSESLGVVTLSLEDLINSINLTLNDLTISGVSLSNISLSVSNNATFKTISGNELTYDSLTKLVDNIYDIYQLYLNKQINGSLTFDLSVKDTTINVKTNINLDLDNKLVYANVILKYNDISIDLDITYQDNTIKLAYGNIVVKLSNEELSNLINYISEKFNLNLGTISLSSIDINSILKSINIILDDKLNLSVDLSSISESLGTVTLGVEDLTDSINLTLNDLTISGFSLSNISLNVSNNATFNSISGDALDYQDMIILVDNIDNLLTLAKKDKFNIKFSTQIIKNDVVRFDVSATLKIKVKEDGSFNLVCNLDIVSKTEDDHDYTIDFSLIDDYIYASVKFASRDDSNYDFLNVKMGLKESLSVLGTVSKFMGINISFLDKFVNLDTLNKDTLGYLIPSESELSNIDFKEYIKRLSVDENSINLYLNGNKLFNSDDDLEIKLIKTNSSLFDTLYINNIYSHNEENNVEKFNMNLSLDDSDFDIELDQSKEYLDISSINTLLDAFLNTASLDNFNVSGTISVNMSVIGLDIPMTLDYEVLVKLYDKVPTIIIKLNNIPVIVGVNNDVPYSFGDTNGGGSRNLTLYIQNNKVYMYRTEQVSRFLGKAQTYEKKLMVSTKTFLADIYYYLLQVGFGFSDSIVSSIKEGVNSDSTHTIDLAKLVKGYSANDNKYTLTLSLKELTGNDDLDTFTISLGTTTIDDKNYLSNLEFNVGINVSVLTLSISSTDSKLNDILGSVDISELDTYIKNYTYLEGELYHARNSSWKKVS